MIIIIYIYINHWYCLMILFLQDTAITAAARGFDSNNIQLPYGCRKFPRFFYIMPWPDKGIFARLPRLTTKKAIGSKFSPIRQDSNLCIIEDAY